jgi:DHA1 family multidrug resistance protein-like MFS transporter
MIGIALSSGGVFVVMQCVFIYLPYSYPKYAASIFASNALIRSSLAAAAVLFARPLFLNLGIGGGVSLLAGLLLLCAIGVYVLYFFGEKLRARSKFAIH